MYKACSASVSVTHTCSIWSHSCLRLLLWPSAVISAKQPTNSVQNRLSFKYRFKRVAVLIVFCYDRRSSSSTRRGDFVQHDALNCLPQAVLSNLFFSLASSASLCCFPPPPQSAFLLLLPHRPLKLSSWLIFFLLHSVILSYRPDWVSLLASCRWVSLGPSFPQTCVWASGMELKLHDPLVFQRELPQLTSTTACNPGQLL